MKLEGTEGLGVEVEARTMEVEGIDSEREVGIEEGTLEGGGIARIGKEEVSIDGKIEDVKSKGREGEEESSVAEGILVTSETIGEDCGNQWRNQK